jgi:hypothetical protein
VILERDEIERMRIERDNYALAMRLAREERDALKTSMENEIDHLNGRLTEEMVARDHAETRNDRLQADNHELKNRLQAAEDRIAHDLEIVRDYRISFDGLAARLADAIASEAIARAKGGG